MSSITLATRLVAFVGKVTSAFLDIKEEDTSLKKGLKAGDAVARRVVYSLADYWLMIVSGAFIILMDRQFEYGPFGLFMLMWAFDIVVANAFVVVWKRTGQDVTLGESYRRAVDVIHSSSRLAGLLGFAGVIIKAAFWDGPEHIVIFFHRELKTELRMLLALLALTALQAAIWTPIYILGFNTVEELWRHLFL